jgi:hypothetical protein
MLNLTIYIEAVPTTSMILSRILNDEVSDTTDDDSSTEAGNIKKKIASLTAAF